MSESAADAVAEVTRAKAEHLRNHLTDGYWHDGCAWCRLRRVHGGTGVLSDDQ